MDPVHDPLPVSLVMWIEETLQWHEAIMASVVVKTKRVSNLDDQTLTALVRQGPQHLSMPPGRTPLLLLPLRSRPCFCSCTASSSSFGCMSRAPNSAIPNASEEILNHESLPHQLLSALFPPALHLRHGSSQSYAPHQPSSSVGSRRVGVTDTACASLQAFAVELHKILGHSSSRRAAADKLLTIRQGQR